VAGEMHVQHNTAWLLSKPDHNVLLGTVYLRDLISRYKGSYVLALAAYNAGPGRVDDWLKQYGDPRSKNIDVIDWIERIPYRETRNYVQRVLEATQVYRARMTDGRSLVYLDHDLLR
jgi:soluble lytic murein transglycosylase